MENGSLMEVESIAESSTWLNGGQKYCGMLPLEHSAILSTSIKRYLVLKNNFRCSF